MTKRDRKQIADEMERYIAERGGVLNERLAAHGYKEFLVTTPHGRARTGVHADSLSPWLWLQFEEPERARVIGCSLPSGKLNCHTMLDMDARSCIAAFKQHLAMVGV